jgi:hypothetical protein
VDQHELADVVQQAGDRQAVAAGVADLRGDSIGGALGGQSVQAQASWQYVPDASPFEEIECRRRRR